MHPTPHFGQPAFGFEERIVDRVGVRLQISFVPFQEFRRTRSPPRRRVVVHDDRMMTISHVRPDPPDPGEWKFAVQHFDAGIVRANYLGPKQLLLHPAVQRLEQFRALRQPAAHRLARNIHSMPLPYLLLPVQWLVIGEFGDNHLRQ